MIEIICNKDDDKGIDEKSSKGTPIRRPKNIKQIGDIDSDKKIYIEDYAFTYINSIAYNKPDEEQSGVLLGEFQKNNNEKCVFIKGVIKSRLSDEMIENGLYFNDKVWTGIYSDIEKYFPNLQVVGWFASVREMTAERMLRFKRVHIDNFAGNLKTFYMIDTSEKEESFYFYENGELKKQRGYVCFYERNYEMQEYMLTKREKKSTEENTDDKVMKNIRNIIKEKDEQRIEKRNGTLMQVAGAFMVVVVLVISINLINNYEKMKRFDKSINELAVQVSNINGNDKGADNKADDDTVQVNKLSGNVYPEESTSAGNTDEKNTDNNKSTNNENNGDTDDSDKTAEVVQENVEKNEPSGQAYIYTVKKGDTISGICRNYYGSTSKCADVIAINNLTDGNKLYVGQQIKLP